MLHKKTWVGFTPGAFAAGHALGLIRREPWRLQPRLRLASQRHRRCLQRQHGLRRQPRWRHATTRTAASRPTRLRSGSARTRPGSRSGASTVRPQPIAYHIVAKLDPQSHALLPGVDHVPRHCPCGACSAWPATPPQARSWPASGYAAASGLGIVCGYSLF